MGYVLTSDADGNATWQADPNTNLLGDVSGPMLSNVVNTVGGSTAAEIHLMQRLAQM
jgi:hypothetical protein